MDSITISIKDLGLFILFVLGCTAMVYLIITLSSLHRIVRRMNGILEAEKGNLKKVMAVLPEAVVNVNEAAVSIRTNVDRVAAVVDSVEGAVSETAAAVADRTQDVFEIARIAGTVLKTIINTFSRTEQ